MKKLVLTSLLIAAPSLANASIYIGANLGMSYMTTTYSAFSDGTAEQVAVTNPSNDNTFAGGFYAGYDFSDQFYNAPMRLELSYTMRGNASSEKTYKTNQSVAGFTEAAGKVKIGIDTLMLNYYWDIPVESKLQPYLTAGVGMAVTSVKVNAAKDSTTDLVWAAGAGVSYPLSNNISMDVSLRYTAKAESESRYENIVLDMDHELFDLLVGLSYRF